MARMNRLLTRLLVALALVFVSAPAMAQWQVANHAVPIGKGPGVIGFGSAAAGASGTVFLGKGASVDPAFVALSQDCTVVSTGVITCTKTNNVSFAASATTDTTNAANISSGTLPNARLDAEVQCIAGLTSAADKIAYFTGLGTCALADLSAAERTYLTTPSSANLRGVLNDETGTGLAYFQGGALGTPSSGTATNLTGLPIAGITGLGTGVGTWLATPSSANLAAAITDETGSGSLVFGTAPRLDDIELGATTDTTLHRSGAGDFTVEGNQVYRAGGTDVALADGGSGSSTAPGARVNFNIDQATTHGDSIYTILSTDRTVITSATLTAARTWTLPAANAVNAGQHVVVADLFGAINGANTLTVQRAGADTINGVTSAALTAQYGYIDLVSDGSSKWTYQAAAGGGSGTVTNATIAAGTGIGVSGTCAITTSGTCTVALSTPVAATNGGTAQSTYTTGDTLYASASNTLSKLAIGSTGQSWIVSGGIPAWGSTHAAIGTTTTASGTAVDFTSIPSWMKQITCNLSGLSTNGTSQLLFRLGDSGGIETTGYLGAGMNTSSAVATSNDTTGVRFSSAAWAASYLINGSITMSLQDAATFNWAVTATLSSSAAGQMFFAAFDKATSAQMDRVEFTMANGTDTFDAGTISCFGS